MTAGIVCAKGESGRLPGKNTMDFCGHPLTAWTIVNMKNSIMIDKTYLTTDNEEIAEIGREYGAEIIWRDYDEEKQAPANVPFCHAIRKIQKDENLGIVVCALPTSPTRLPNDFDDMIKLKNKMKSKEMSANVPHQEANEWEIIGPNMLRIAFWNKTGKYATGGGGMCAYDADYYIDVCDMDDDFWTWEQIVELKQKNHKAALWFYRDFPYYPLKIWQAEDIDYQDEFDFVQLIMQHYILKGRGIEIYEEYYEKEKKE